MLTANVSVC